MIIQPFVENSIWHGITPLDGKGMIAILLLPDTEKSIKIVIEDNGIGMKKSAVISVKNEQHMKLGMELTRKRLEIFGKKFHVATHIDFCEISPESSNPGTRVVLFVPFTYSLFFID